MYPLGKDRANCERAGLPTRSHPQRRIRWWAGVGGGLLALAVAALGGLWFTLGQRRVAVRGRSMAPLLDDGELTLVDRLAYWLGAPRRGDVVLVRGRATGDGGAGPALLLKRVVGLPGEVVTLARDQLLIDGRPLDLGRPVVGSSPGAWALRQDAYFLLSENLAVGTDSRHTGPVARADLLGRAWLVYAPRVRPLSRTPIRFVAPDVAAGQTRKVTQAMVTNA